MRIHGAKYGDSEDILDCKHMVNEWENRKGNRCHHILLANKLSQRCQWWTPYEFN
jgi:hypothetical protein